MCGGGGEGVSATSQGVQKPFPCRRNGMQFAPGGDAFWEQSMCPFSPGGGSEWVCLGFGPPTGGAGDRAGGWTALRCLPTHTALRIEVGYHHRLRIEIELLHTPATRR